jgi:hypothetical protein
VGNLVGHRNKSFESLTLNLPCAHSLVLEPWVCLLQETKHDAFIIMVGQPSEFGIRNFKVNKIK